MYRTPKLHLTTYRKDLAQVLRPSRTVLWSHGQTTAPFPPIRSARYMAHHHG